MRLLNAIMQAVIDIHVEKFKLSADEAEANFMGICAVPEVPNAFRVYFNGTPKLTYYVEVRKVSETDLELSDIEKQTGYRIITIVPMSYRPLVEGEVVKAT